jgi:hypothetical protein
MQTNAMLQSVQHGAVGLSGEPLQSKHGGLHEPPFPSVKDWVACPVYRRNQQIIERVR